MKTYELNLSVDELEKRTNKDYLATKKMLKIGAPEYENLADGDKQALKHLVKAAYILEKINMQLDNHDNLAFKEFLEEEIKKDGQAFRRKKIFCFMIKYLCPLFAAIILISSVANAFGIITM